jgi:hypothetical protein
LGVEVILLIGIGGWMENGYEPPSRAGSLLAAGEQERLVGLPRQSAAEDPNVFSRADPDLEFSAPWVAKGLHGVFAQKDGLLQALLDTARDQGGLVPGKLAEHRRRHRLSRPKSGQ